MKNTNKKGFTLVELVIVIAVIAILAAVLIPTFTSVINRAKQSAALQELRAELTEIEIAYALSGTTIPEEDMVFEKNGFFFLYDYDTITKKAELVSTTATASTSLLKVPTKLASGITLWRANVGAVLDVTVDGKNGNKTYWGAKPETTTSGNRGVGIVTGAKSGLKSVTFTIKDDNGKTITSQSGDISSVTYGVYDDMVALSSYGTGYFTYVVTYYPTSGTPETITGVFYKD